MIEFRQSNKHFETSYCGKVRNINTGYILKPCKDKDGYPRVATTVRGTHASLFVHRAVALAWIPNPDDLPQVNHINGDKEDFSPSNLEWCTAQHNVQHAFDTGLKENAKGDASVNSKLTEGLVHKICALLQEGYRNIDIIRNLNIDSIGDSRSLISSIRSRQRWQHISKDYIFSKGRRKETISPDTCHRICSLIQEGESNTTITDKLNNPTVTDSFVGRVRRGETYKTISYQYTFPDRAPRTIRTRPFDDEIVHRVCELIQSGLSNKQILATLGSDNIKTRVVVAIKAGESYKDISKNYNW